MQIHELPSASPSASDYIPIDNGTATRKATLSSIDIGSNEITFTSGDTSSPSSWQTVAVMASNTAANLMNAISKMVANIRWLYNRLGTSSTGTTATTVTGAIAEHSTKIGSADMGTTATTLTGAIAEVNDSVNTNTEDIATLNSKFIYRSINIGTVSIAAGQRTSVTYPCDYAGYTPFGIVGIYVSGTEVFSINRFSISGNNISVTFENSYTSERSSPVYVMVLYVKQ